MSLFNQLSNNLPKPNDTWTTLEILLWKLLNGQKAIGVQKIALTNAVQVLTIPDSGASKAIITIEADSTSANLGRVARFYETGALPTGTDGLTLGDSEVYEILGAENLANFKIIGIEALKNHVLQVQYFSY